MFTSMSIESVGFCCDGCIQLDSTHSRSVGVVAACQLVLAVDPVLFAQRVNLLQALAALQSECDETRGLARDAWLEETYFRCFGQTLGRVFGNKDIDLQREGIGTHGKLFDNVVGLLSNLRKVSKSLLGNATQSIS